MDLTAPHDHTFGVPLYHPQINVRICLLARSQHAISLDVRLSARPHHILLLKLLKEGDETIVVLRLSSTLLIRLLADNGKSVHHVHAHTPLNAGPAQVAEHPGHELLFQKIFNTLVNMGKAIDRFSGDMRCGHQ